MFMKGFIPYALLVKDMLDLGEEFCFLVVVMAFHKPVPGEAVANKVRVVLGKNVWCLKIDRVEATKDGIVQQGHVGSAFGPYVILYGRQKR